MSFKENIFGICAIGFVDRETGEMKRITQTNEVCNPSIDKELDFGFRQRKKPTQRRLNLQERVKRRRAGVKTKQFKSFKEALEARQARKKLVRKQRRKRR